MQAASPSRAASQVQSGRAKGAHNKCKRGTLQSACRAAEPCFRGLGLCYRLGGDNLSELLANIIRQLIKPVLITPLRGAEMSFVLRTGWFGYTGWKQEKEGWFGRLLARPSLSGAVHHTACWGFVDVVCSVYQHRGIQSLLGVDRQFHYRLACVSG